MKNVFIISTSFRGGTHSELLAKEASRGSEEAGNSVELLSPKGKKIQYCEATTARSGQSSSL